MAYLNKITLLGNLTSDPELNYSKNGTPYCRFAIAQNLRTPEGQKLPAEFFDCVVWRGWAENFVNSAAKGMRVLVDGRLRHESWEDRESGQKRSKVRVSARVVCVIPKTQDESRVSTEIQAEATQGSIPV